jgi:hypothetical protein
MQYERPSIVSRERLAALLIVTPSDQQPDNQPDGQDSDVRLKEHIVPVRW